jgi:hypothetical protein
MFRFLSIYIQNFQKVQIWQKELYFIIKLSIGLGIKKRWIYGVAKLVEMGSKQSSKKVIGKKTKE